MNPRAEFRPYRLNACVFSSPKTDTNTFALRVSPLTSTSMTVTFFTRGSFSPNKIVELTVSRMACDILAMRRDVMSRQVKTEVENR